MLLRASKYLNQNPRSHKWQQGYCASIIQLKEISQQMRFSIWRLPSTLNQLASKTTRWWRLGNHSRTWVTMDISISKTSTRMTSTRADRTAGENGMLAPLTMCRKVQPSGVHCEACKFMKQENMVHLASAKGSWIGTHRIEWMGTFG